MNISRYDLKHKIKQAKIEGNKVIVELVSGQFISSNFTRRLQEATPAQRDHFEVSGGGWGLHWEEIDEDLSVQGMMAGRT